jgi:hypothetical protein
MSWRTSATPAAKTMVVRPTGATIDWYSSPASSGCRRASRKMPAFTIVAECR